MSGKSLFLSFLSFVTFVGVILAIIYIFKVHFLMAILGLLLFAIPVTIRNKAVDESRGKVDNFIAKYLVPILAVLATLTAILSLALWI